MKILVTGGEYPRNWEEIQIKNNEDFIRFRSGRILLIDWDSKQVEQEITYESPNEIRNPSMMFKGGEIHDGFLNVVTNSEMVTYNLSTWQIERHITHPSFNDLHGVFEEEGRFWLANTGLEMIQLCDGNGAILEEYNMASTPTWPRFKKGKDYRLIGSTKPHETHTNHVFCVDGEHFATRFRQKDAISLGDPTRRFSIEVGNPHDGVCHGTRVYFTTTNGHILVFDPKTQELLINLNLQQTLEKAGMKPDGWCRGILPLDENRVLVGFTQLRSTKFKEFVSWVKHLGNTPAPSRVIEVNLSNNTVLSEYTLPETEGRAIFSILLWPFGN
ncbi:MAG: hypothetical protein M0P70_09450 [Desulfobulbaceae bacterium]|nr:hypothetical protein [Desulfobulbaceae bacterium]